ncbi:phospholipase/carboxylesterase [Tahibacter aquaticus]|uniref:Phospholipase/carboxylesterase n=2 Tax=Tahibacter aquaticus TaxID=520092 RepID=A0A4R6YQE9_9GAMM|nr:phospholipase/carboxylesterase [Tahibacter aquaticus]
MTRLRVVAMAFAIVAAAWAQTSAAKEVSGALSARPLAPAGAIAVAGKHRLRAGTTAVLYVPAAIAAGAPAPFLLLLHGAGGKGEDMIRLFKEQADRRGIVLLAPDSADRSWDVALSMSGNDGAPSFGRDVKRIDAILQEAFARVDVDPQRVAVAGFSDGASTALSIGARNAALFPATLAFSAGGMVADWNGPTGRVFFSHGAKDRVLPIAIARDSLAPALRASGFAVTFVTFDGGHSLPAPVLEQAMVWWLGPGPDSP